MRRLQPGFEPSRRTVLALSALASAPLIGPDFAAAADPWPTRAVKIIVPVAPGTATDLTARIFADKLSPLWGQPVVIENRPGADGLIAIGSFVSGRDDHTLLFSFSTAVSLNPFVHAKLPYDPAVDLVPVTTTTEVVLAVGAHIGLGASTLGELVARVKAEPGKFNWAAAPGLPRFVFEGFRNAAGLSMAYVPYNQTGSAAQDLGEGRIHVTIAAVSTLLPVAEAGKIKLLAVTSRDRAALVPDVPSAIEAGHPSLVVPALGCVFGWKDMPVELRARIARDIDAAATDSAVVDRLAKVGQTVRRSTPADLARLLAEQRVQLAPIAAALAAAR